MIVSKCQLDAAELALQQQIQKVLSQEAELSNLRRDLELERTKRISADAIATARMAEIDRLIEQNRELRESLSQVTSERLKSLDILNQRLMEPRTEAPPQDIKQFEHLAVQKAGVQAVSKIRQLHHAVDMAILGKYYPGFKKPEIPTPDKQAGGAA